MITEEEAVKEDAIENLFCKKFEKLPRHQMTEDVSKIFIQLCFSKRNDIVIPEDKKPFLYKLIEKRLSLFTYEIKDSRIILFLAMVAQTPGTAVMYLTYLQYYCKKHNIREITFDNFSMEIFPMGFPSDEDLHTLWEETKVKRNEGGAANLVDFIGSLKSIQFETV